ncbi:ribokinase [Agromyces protaetiae]|uniref:ribokinase n=1 Tax=Agromyces protaetiae TaxID=2509455 RepID=UPI0013ED108A|nr:ribokinase [Agromyces protaetiae]
MGGDEGRSDASLRRRPHVLVVGSLNIDHTVVVDELPRPGETVTARRSYRMPGGKGANESVAAARVGADVVFVAAVGDDEQGRSALRSLAELGVDTSWAVERSGALTGTASITVDASGENTIVVDAGANATLAPDALRPEQFEGAAALLLTLEVPDPVMVAAMREAKAHSVPVIFNPSPLRAHDRELVLGTDILVVNEDEFRALASPDGADDTALRRAAEALGVPVVVVTCGSRGVIVVDRTAGAEVAPVPSIAVTALDTTGCGDAFTGALAARLAAGDELSAAVGFATSYAALVATRRGAQASYPDLPTYETWIGSVGSIRA